MPEDAKVQYFHKNKYQAEGFYYIIKDYIQYHRIHYQSILQNVVKSKIGEDYLLLQDVVKT